MNSSLSGSASPPPPRAAAPSSCRRAEDTRGPSHRGDEFERVLRDKAGARDGAAKRDAAAKPGDAGDAGEQGDADAADCAAAETASLPAPPPMLSPFLALSPRGAAADITAPPGARGVTDESAAARSPLPHAIPSALAAADATAAWQVHLPTSLGTGLELRATRIEGSAQAQPGWALSIASPAHEAALLARHAPRLDERLRARTLEVCHVRIERDEREASGEEGT